MLLSILVTGSAWSADAIPGVTSDATATVKGRAPEMTQGNIKSSSTTIGINAILSMDDADLQWKFKDEDDDDESGTLYEWKADGVVVSSGTNDTNKSYKITAQDLGKVFSLHVTPKTDPLKTDPSNGITVPSKNTLSAIKANTVTKVKITGYTGNPLVKGSLGVELLCSGTDGAGCGNESDYTYQWQIEGRDLSTGMGNGIYTNISQATSSTYIPTKLDQRLKIKVVVKNNITTAAEAGVAAPTAKAKAKVTQ
jgi:hypothetical protein